MIHIDYTAMEWAKEYEQLFGCLLLLKMVP